MRRPLLAKDLSKTCEFMVHCQVRAETHTCTVDDDSPDRNSERVSSRRNRSCSRIRWTSPSLPRRCRTSERYGDLALVSSALAAGSHACVSVFQRSSLPRFLIRGHLDATSCAVTRPLTGELLVESSEVAIKSIELQLVRVETCGEKHTHTHTLACL